jgi:hypothetical protein
VDVRVRINMGFSASLRVCMLVCEFGRVGIGVFNQ